MTLLHLFLCLLRGVCTKQNVHSWGTSDMFIHKFKIPIFASRNLRIQIMKIFNMTVRTLLKGLNISYAKYKYVIRLFFWKL